MRVRAETTLRLHDVVVDNSQDAEVSRSASVLGERKVEPGREPVLARPRVVRLIRRVTKPTGIRLRNVETRALDDAQWRVLRRELLRN